MSQHEHNHKHILKNHSHLIGILAIVLVSVGVGYYLGISKTGHSTNVFEKKNECAQFANFEFAHTRIQNSGRLFENDTYKVREIFYSPRLNSCVYAWELYTLVEPYKIYSIDDLFGGEIFTAGISPNASELWLAEIERLKK